MAANILYFVFFAGVFALMMRFGCGAHVMGHRAKHENSPLNGPSDATENESAIHGGQETDPVCRMIINKGQGKSAVWEDHAYYFCSPACRDKFETNPVRYTQFETSGPTLPKEFYGPRS